MDWITLLISAIPALITGIVSYMVAVKKAKSDLDNAQIELNKTLIDQETALKKIESEQKIAIETIERNAESELKKMRAKTEEQIALYNSRSKTDLETLEQKMILEKTGDLFSKMADEGKFDLDSLFEDIDKDFGLKR